uniref:Protein RALF-like 33 n=1 Tax=Cucumis melo TaxID=3656 RepID=A0A9I9DC88_CUCME
MKSWLICLALIGMLVVGQEVTAETKHLKFLDPCNQPSPPPTCSKTEKREEANSYDRGCSAINRCRGG